jgi:hypothetical protein
LLNPTVLHPTVVLARYLYSRVSWTWYRLGEAHDLRVSPVSTDSEWSHLAVLHIANISLQDGGTYACVAERDSEGEVGLAKTYTKPNREKL